MTEEERRLWYCFLRNLDYHFARQKVLGHYIVDFYCAKAKLIIELDGAQHYEEENEERDKIRDAYFEEQGIKVLRYSNLQLNTQFKDICEDILLYLKGEKR